ncbi:hypothetical protein K493DRAFT_408116 [Basidiobolus meristosporus CBS 931.73]|uniref:Uncharacterized protein n=1 Tax=Basidiobolus meristosporus CBS 931.73 TaxID=1314790 RepID=A0A1Y1Y8K6_9FUNG|nr:hypothetical protein K493DRAFT_408116 [Basidiobolus meristosporus CBS 931.73]|eukprot:ORX94076.1 hypothetical protein K493DRAFT_408116 [Basidiobolus meristosporus CBS 931.73]
MTDEGGEIEVPRSESSVEEDTLENNNWTEPTDVEHQQYTNLPVNWSPQMEIALFQAMGKNKPVGIVGIDSGEAPAIVTVKKPTRTKRNVESEPKSALSKRGRGRNTIGGVKRKGHKRVLTEGNGEIYVASYIVEEIARQIGENILVELCRLDDAALRSGRAKNILGFLRNAELDELVKVEECEIHVSAGLSSREMEAPVKTEELIDSSGFHIPRLSKSPKLDKTIRRVRSLNAMAIEEGRSIIYERLSAGGVPSRKMGAIAENYTSHLINHRFPRDSDHSSSHSPPATPAHILESNLRERKRKRPVTPLSAVTASAIAAPTVTVTTEGYGRPTHVVEDVTEHIRSLHQQQKHKAVADGHSYIHPSRPNGALSKPPGPIRGKNTRNLTISTPSYGEAAGAPKSAPIHPTYQHLGNSGLRIYSAQGGQIYPGNTNQSLIPPNTAIPHEPSQYSHGVSSYHPSSYIGATPTVKSNAPPQDPSVIIPQPSVPPRPVTAHPYSSQANYYTNKALPQRNSPSNFLPHTTASNGHAGSKQQFMMLFESLYDNVDSARGLKAQLEDQIRKSTTLLQTLQASGPMIEGLVRSHFRDMQGQFIEKYDSSIEDIVRRLDRIEERQLHIDQQRSKNVNRAENTEDPRSKSQQPDVETEVPTELPSPPPILSHPRLDKEGHLTKVVKSQGLSSDMKTRDYEEMIKGLVDRLETLERKIDRQ